MRKSRRSPKIPQAVLQRISEEERPLLGEQLHDGRWALITRNALLVCDEEQVGLRAAWDEIETGSWDGQALTFTITWADRIRPREALVFMHDDIATFTASLRERVQSAVVHTETEDIGEAQVRAVVRRAEDGSLYSQLTAFGYLAGTDEEDRELDALETRAREAAGLPD